MRYAVVGSGAIGCYYGGRLAEHGADVHFLFHSDYEAVCANGLTVKSVGGDFKIEKPQAYKDVRQMPKADVVIVGLKTTRQELIKELVAPLVHSQTIVLLIQNGIGVEADAAEQLPEGTQIAAGLAFICSTKVAPGVVNHTCYGSLGVAPYSVRDDERLGKVISDFKESEVEVTKVDYLTARWRKAMWNMPFNGLSVALMAQTDEMLGDAAGERIVRDLMKEVVMAAQALGAVKVDEAFAEKMIATTRVMAPYSPSMRVDYDNKREMELKYLYEKPIEMAERAGVQMPKMRMLLAQLQFQQNRYLRK
ncbi:MAG: 2-dehydropantoate 2-reductase [Bacteroidales bacterium]|nr:2-dehydropantoate 2-reductase [Bacteroidales bacterium]